MAKEFYCNKCGKKLDMWDIQEDFSMQRSLGYGSKYDGSDFDIDLCCGCMDELIDEMIEKCVISPVISP